MTPRALMILHPGFEEIEAVAPIDLLARAGVQVIQASTDTGLLVTGRNGITMQATTEKQFQSQSIPSHMTLDLTMLSSSHICLITSSCTI